MTTENQVNWDEENIIKVRDDNIPISLKWDRSSNTFSAINADPSWYRNIKNGERENIIAVNDQRGRIEPWLTALFQS